MDIQITPRPQWHSYTSYLLVMVGAIVGVGNVLLFPLAAFRYGASFIVFCLICEILLAMPLLYAELLLGQRGKQNVVGSITLVSSEVQASPWWRKLGWLYFAVAFLTFSYYLVYAAFPVGFLASSLQTLSATTTSLYIMPELEVLTQISILLPCTLLLLLTVMWVVKRGIHRGLEVISCITVPVYLVIFLGLAGYAVGSGHFSNALQQLSWINADNSLYMVFVAALAFSFLKLKVGIGSMVVYASHLPFSVSLKRSTCWIVLIDILVSLLALVIVVPLMHAVSTDAYTGDLGAHNMAIIFKHVSGGALIASLFFFAAVLAAWTPLIAMLETMVTTISEEWNMKRTCAVWLVGSALFLLILFIVLCQTDWISNVVFGNTYPQILKDVALEKLTPITAFFLSIFVGWVVDRRISEEELRFKPCVYAIWRFFIRYLIPGLILFIFVQEFPI